MLERPAQAGLSGLQRQRSCADRVWRSAVPALPGQRPRNACELPALRQQHGLSGLQGQRPGLERSGTGSVGERRFQVSRLDSRCPWRLQPYFAACGIVPGLRLTKRESPARSIPEGVVFPLFHQLRADVALSEASIRRADPTRSRPQAAATLLRTFPDLFLDCLF